MQSTANAALMQKIEGAIEETAKREPSIASAAVMTADGFPLVILMGKGEAEKLQLAAAIASLGSLSEQTASQLGIGKYKDLMLRCGQGHLFVRRVGEANMLAVLTDKNAQLGVIHLVIDRLAKRLNRLLM